MFLVFPLYRGRLMGVAVFTKVVHVVVVALDFSNSLSLALVVRGECCSLEKLVDRQTSDPFELSDSLSEDLGGAFSLEITSQRAFSFICCDLGAIVTIGEKIVTVLKKVYRCRNLPRQPFYNRAMKVCSYLLIMERVPQSTREISHQMNNSYDYVIEVRLYILIVGTLSQS